MDGVATGCSLRGLSMLTDQERSDEFLREQRLSHVISEGMQAGERRRSYEQTGELIGRALGNTRNRALLLAASRRLRRVYLWGSTFCLFVLSPLLFFAPRLLVSYFGPSGWYLVLLFLGAIVLPFCALRGYFIWVRSHWYRWIGKGIKDDYEEGELL